MGSLSYASDHFGKRYLNGYLSDPLPITQHLAASIATRCTVPRRSYSPSALIRQRITQRVARARPVEAADKAGFQGKKVGCDLFRGPREAVVS